MSKMISLVIQGALRSPVEVAVQGRDGNARHSHGSFPFEAGFRLEVVGWDFALKRLHERSLNFHIFFPFSPHRHHLAPAKSSRDGSLFAVVAAVAAREALTERL